MTGQLTKKKLYSAFSWSFLDRFMLFGVSFFVQIVVARILDPAAYGIIAVVLIFVNLANTLAMGGFSSALIQKKGADDGDYNSAFWVSEAFALALYALIFAFAPAIEEFYAIGGLSIYIRVFAIILFLDSFNAIQRAYLQRMFNFRSTFIVSLVAGAASGAIGIMLAIAQFGVWAIIVQTLSSSLITCVMLMHFVPWKPALSFSYGRAFELFSFGWKLALTGLINTLSESLIDTVTGKTVSVADLGFYTQGKKYPVTLATLIQSPLSNVLFPAFSSIQEEPEEVRKLMKRGLQIGSFLIAPLLFLLALISEPLVDVLLTDKWLPCVPVMQAICLIYSCLLIETINLRVYVALGRSDVYLYLHIGRAVVSIIVSTVSVVITRNIYVLAICFAVSQTLYILFVETYPAKKICGYSAIRQLKDVAPIYVISAIAFAVCVPLSLQDWFPILRMLVICAAFAMVYLMLSYAFKLVGLRFILTEVTEQFAKRFHKKNSI